MVFGYNEESLCPSNEENKIYEKSTSSSGPMNSPWPMKCHDTHHTGRSPYSTADNPGIEKWRFKCDWVEGGIVIGDDGTLYFGDSDYLFALNSDGSVKWKYHTIESITSSPAIAEDGIIYVGMVLENGNLMPTVLTSHLPLQLQRMILFILERYGR